MVSAKTELYTKYYGNTKESMINLTTGDIKSQKQENHHPGDLGYSETSNLYIHIWL